MGVDTIMFAAIRAKVDEAELRKFNVIMANAFGPERFFIRHWKSEYHPTGVDRNNKYGDKPHHATSFASKEDNQRWGIARPKGFETMIEVHLWTRYYGPGYERGDLPLILNVIKFIQTYWGKDDSIVWYGGDSGDSLEKMTDGEINTLWNHFVKNAHIPYQTYELPGFEKQKSHLPFCETCQLPYNENGSGAGYSGTYCVGCGHKLNSTDGGKTYHEPQKGDPFYGM